MTVRTEFLPQLELMLHREKFNKNSVPLTSKSYLN